MSTTPNTRRHRAAHHDTHGDAGYPGHGSEPNGHDLTRPAVSASLHCLAGCAIGQVVGLVLADWWEWPTGPSIALAVVLAFVFGYALSIAPVLRSGLTFKGAVGVALTADTLSILTMEIVDNAVMLAVPGAMEVGVSDWLFWATLVLALAVAFAVTVPVNRALMARGKGHAGPARTTADV